MIPQLDLQAEYRTIKDELDDALIKVAASGHYILDEQNQAFEKEIATYVGTKYAIAVASGTDAIRLALLAAGLTPGDEVITTPFSFIASADAIAQIGGIPVFADIDAETFNIDTKKIEEKITDKTKAILPVHLFGQPADMETLLKLAEHHRLYIIEDCAQAIGAGIKGKKVGTFGKTGCFSFFPTKNLGCYGDGGLITTDDKDIDEKTRALRVHGATAKYHHEFLGFNSRLDEIQAAILRIKLKHLDQWTKNRQEISKRYGQLLSTVDITLPHTRDDVTHVFNQYTIKYKKRDALAKRLKENGIATAVYYPLPLHLQNAFGYLGYKPESLPVSEQIASKVISLPIYPQLSSDDVATISESVRSIVLNL